MQMIDVLKRLAALDANNPNVVNPASPKKKQQVKEDTSVAECGPMGMMGSMGMDRPSTPASFSINASAADGQEVSQMLRDIMNLAGMGHEKSPGDMGIDKEPVTGGNMPAPSENELMRSMLDTMNDPEDGDIISAAPPAPVDDMGGMDAGMGGMDDMGSAEAVPDDVGSMADHVRGMADELADTDKEELGLESWDNTPADPTNVPEFDSNKFAYNPNAGGVNKGLTNQPTATLEDQLYNEYKKFVSEASHQEKTTMKHVKNPTPGEKKAAKDIKAGTAGYADRVAMLKSAEKDGRLKEAEKQTMSRAAKGYEKYGKKGMKALADAGKAGKDLEPVRAKYNKYD
jgi:hypothetical protein